MLILKRDTFSVETSGPVVTAEEIRTVEEAARIIEAAKAEAAEIVRKTQEASKAEKMRGYADGVEQANAETLMRKIDLVAEADEYLRHIEREMIKVLTHTLRRCVGEIGEEKILASIVRKELAEASRAQRFVKIYVAEPMLEPARNAAAELVASMSATLELEILADPTLDNVSCRVETSAGSVTGSYYTQVAAVARAMRSRFSQRS